MFTIGDYVEIIDSNIKGRIEKINKQYATILYNDKFVKVDLNNIIHTKQKNNAYYHIKAINLPFQNIEFYYLDMEE